MQAASSWVSATATSTTSTYGTTASSTVWSSVTFLTWTFTTTWSFQVTVMYSCRNYHFLCAESLVVIGVVIVLFMLCFVHNWCAVVVYHLFADDVPWWIHLLESHFLIFHHFHLVIMHLPHQVQLRHLRLFHRRQQWTAGSWFSMQCRGLYSFIASKNTRI